MRPHNLFSAGPEDGRLQVLWEDGERALYRGRRAGENGAPDSVLALRLTAERPRPASVDRLAHEHRLQDHLEGAWAARPLELVAIAVRRCWFSKIPVACRSTGISADRWRHRSSSRSPSARSINAASSTKT